jgi:signal recognition particle receptor subunit beta
VSWLSRKGGKSSGRARQGAPQTTDGPAGDELADRPVRSDHFPDLSFDLSFDPGPAPSLVPSPGRVARPATSWPPAPAPVWPPGLLAEPTAFKVVVAGPFAAGKTTFVRGVAEGDGVDTETHVSDGSADRDGRKELTTVGLDFGALDVPSPDGRGAVRVALFGTPGQQRFSFMWRILSEGMRAFVVLVDASRQHSRDQARDILRAFRAIAPEAPFVVAVNRWDETDDVDRMVLSLGLRAHDVPRLVRADIRDHDAAIGVLQLALQEVTPATVARYVTPAAG